MRSLVLGTLFLSLPAFAEDPAPPGEEAPAPAEEDAPAPAPADAPPPAPAEPPAAATPPPPAPEEGIAPVFGVHFGPIISLSPLRTTVIPRLEAGVELPFVERRVRVVAHGAYARPRADGGGDAEQVGGEWTYDLRQNEFLLGIAATVAFLPPGDFNVEASLGPELYVLTSKVDGEAGGAAFGESRERYSRGGLLAALGGRYGIGPGEAVAQLGFSTSKLNGVVTGPSSTRALLFTVGYRLVL